jgi:hypothetical protein
MTAPKISKMHNRVKLAAVQKALAHPEKASHLDNMPVPKNDLWDDANVFYDTAMAAVQHLEGELLLVLQETMNSPEAQAMVTDSTALANAVKILNKDLTSHLERLNSIKAKHDGKSGAVKTIDEAKQVFQIHTEYQEALEAYEGNIIPLHAQITYLLGLNHQVADALLKAEQDPKVITDIEIKEPVVEQPAVKVE